MGVNKKRCQTCEEISNAMKSMLFKGGCAQITIGVDNTDCDTYEETSNGMKSVVQG